jgi:hypothetical protein
MFENARVEPLAAKQEEGQVLSKRARKIKTKIPLLEESVSIK